MKMQRYFLLLMIMAATALSRPLSDAVKQTECLRGTAEIGTDLRCEEITNGQIVCYWREMDMHKYRGVVKCIAFLPRHSKQISYGALALDAVPAGCENHQCLYTNFNGTFGLLCCCDGSGCNSQYSTEFGVIERATTATVTTVEMTPEIVIRSLPAATLPSDRGEFNRTAQFSNETHSNESAVNHGNASMSSASQKSAEKEVIDAVTVRSSRSIPKTSPTTAKPATPRYSTTSMPTSFSTKKPEQLHQTTMTSDSAVHYGESYVWQWDAEDGGDRSSDVLDIDETGPEYLGREETEDEAKIRAIDKLIRSGRLNLGRQQQKQLTVEKVYWIVPAEPNVHVFWGRKTTPAGS